MCFSLDLINFSGADSLHMLFLAVLFAVLKRCPSHFQWSQAYLKASIEAECVNVLMRKCVSEFVNALVKIHEVPPWYAVGSADNHRRRITEGSPKEQ